MCTNFNIKYDYKGVKNSGVIVGRAMDNKEKMKPIFYVHGRGQPFGEFESAWLNGLMPNDTKDVEAKYGYVGVCLDLTSAAKSQLGERPNPFSAYFTFEEDALRMVTDGMNEQGLSVGFLAMYGTELPPRKIGKNNNIPFILLCNWLLSQYANIKEVKEYLINYHVYVPKFPDLSDAFIFYVPVCDSTGASMVIEFKNGEMTFSDNPVGVSTNEPWLNWHLENLNNYAFVHSYTTNPFKIRDQKIIPHEGGGMAALPGPHSSVSRFTFVTYEIYKLLELKDQAAALDAGTHILNTIDNSPGLTLGGENPNLGGNPEAPLRVETTRWAVLKDLTQKVLLLRTYDNMSYCEIDLSKIDFSKTEKQNIEIVQHPLTYQIHVQ